MYTWASATVGLAMSTAGGRPFVAGGGLHFHTGVMDAAFPGLITAAFWLSDECSGPKRYAGQSACGLAADRACPSGAAMPTAINTQMNAVASRAVTLPPARILSQERPSPVDRSLP